MPSCKDIYCPHEIISSDNRTNLTKSVSITVHSLPIQYKVFHTDEGTLVIWLIGGGRVLAVKSLRVDRSLVKYPWGEAQGRIWLPGVPTLLSTNVC